MAAISFGFDTTPHHLHGQNRPLSGEEVQVSNKLIAKDEADGTWEKAEVRHEAIKQLQNSVNYSVFIIYRTPLQCFTAAHEKLYNIKW